MEWKLFNESNPEFARAEWYEDIESAHHLEEEHHRGRLIAALDFVNIAIDMGGDSVVDLGCGDGGLLELLKQNNIKSWGYDLMPKNIEYATNIRNVDARYTDFKNDEIEYADIAVMTEVLEHLENPHETVKNLPSRFLVASSPYNENNIHHYEFHLWAWDNQGYIDLMNSGGYDVLYIKNVSGWSQIVLAIRN
jgi:SAM-dependent methyltransferase